MGNLASDFYGEDPEKSEAGSFIAEWLYQYIVNIVDLLFTEIFRQVCMVLKKLL